MSKLKNVFEGTLGIIIFIIFIAVALVILWLILSGFLGVIRFLGYNFNYILLLLIAIGLIYTFTLSKGDEDKYEINPFLIQYRLIIVAIGLVILFVIYKYDNYFRIYTDGNYCAEVSVYNPNSSNYSDYNLFVKVEEGSVSKIYWNNGGWLDESHFDLNESTVEYGEAYFDDDRDREFYITLIGRGTDCR